MALKKKHWGKQYNQGGEQKHRGELASSTYPIAKIAIK